jgi:hypothetical protein
MCPPVTIDLPDKGPWEGANIGWLVSQAGPVDVNSQLQVTESKPEGSIKVDDIFITTYTSYTSLQMHSPS